MACLAIEKNKRIAIRLQSCRRKHCPSCRFFTTNGADQRASGVGFLTTESPGHRRSVASVGSGVLWRAKTRTVWIFDANHQHTTGDSTAQLRTHEFDRAPSNVRFDCAPCDRARFIERTDGIVLVLVLSGAVLVLDFGWKRGKRFVVRGRLGGTCRWSLRRGFEYEYEYRPAA